MKRCKLKKLLKSHWPTLDIGGYLYISVMFEHVPESLYEDFEICDCGHCPYEIAYCVGFAVVQIRKKHIENAEDEAYDWSTIENFIQEIDNDFDKCNTSDTITIYELDEKDNTTLEYYLAASEMIQEKYPYREIYITKFDPKGWSISIV